MMNHRRKRARVAGWGLVLALMPFASFSLVAGADEPKAGTAAPASPAQFVILLKPARASQQVTEEEKAKINQHFDYLKGLQAEGKLLIAGLTTDDYLGIVVIQARDKLDAERIMASDPAVGANIFLAELHPFRVALMPGGK